MKILGSDILQELKDISEIEVQRSQILLAIYLRKMCDKTEKSIEDLKNGLNFQVDFYGRKSEEYASKIDEILNKYSEELEKVTSEYENLYANVELELQEALANQKIMITNIKRNASKKSQFMQTDNYKEYVATKEKLQNQIRNSEKKEEFDRLNSTLDNLVNPASIFDTKINTYVSKFYNYKEIIENCEKKKRECISNIDTELDSVIQVMNEKALVVSKKSSPFNIIRKIMNMFTGKSKLEKNVLKRAEDKINMLSEQNENRIKEIEEVTIDFVANIKMIKDKVNEQYNTAIG